MEFLPDLVTSYIREREKKFHQLLGQISHAINSYDDSHIFPGIIRDSCRTLLAEVDKVTPTSLNQPLHIIPVNDAEEGAFRKIRDEHSSAALVGEEDDEEYSTGEPEEILASTRND